MAALADDLGDLIDANIGEEARTAAMEDLVEVHRRLSDIDPDRWLVELADALTSLHEQIDGYEEPERVLNVAEETVRVLRRIDPAAGGRRTWMYPWALDDLAADLRGAGRHAQALAAVTESIEVRVTAVRVDPRLVSPTGNPAMPMPVPMPDVLTGMPGMVTMATSMMKSKFSRKKVAGIRELLDVARESGVRLIACQMTMDVFEYDQKDFIEGVEFGGAAAFLSEARKGHITLFV